MTDNKTNAPSGPAATEAPSTVPSSTARDIGALSQWQLIRRRFSKHKLAVIALRVLVLLYVVAIFVEFFAPYTREWHDLDHMYSPPQLPRLSFRHGFHTYPVQQHIDPITFRKAYLIDRNQIVKLGFFVKGQAYKLWGVIPMNRRFFGVKGKSEKEAGKPTDPLSLSATAQPVWYLLGGRQVRT